jgi:hypothetical protein
MNSDDGKYYRISPSLQNHKRKIKCKILLINKVHNNYGKFLKQAERDFLQWKLNIELLNIEKIYFPNYTKHHNG